jgi:hypothetical protein
MRFRDPYGLGPIEDLQEGLDTLSSLPVIGFIFRGPASFGHGVRNRVHGTIMMSSEATFDEGECLRGLGNAQMALGAALTGAVATAIVGVVQAGGALTKAGGGGGGSGAFTVRRFLSKAELKQLRRHGIGFDPTRGEGIPTTTRNLAPKSQDYVRTMTGAKNVDRWVDLDVTGLARGPTTSTRRGLPEYPIRDNLLPEMIIGFGKVPK